MQNSSVQPDSRSLVEQALHHIQLLSDILDQIVDKSDSDKPMNSQKEQLADLTKMIKQWEAKNLPVPDEFRTMKMNLSAEIEYVEYKITSLDRIKKGLKNALSKIPDEKLFLAKGSRNSKAPTNRSHLPKTDRAIYRDLVLKILRDLGGSARSILIREEIEKRLVGKFTEKDLERASSGGEIWWNDVQWERLRMVHEGLLLNNSPKGVWELSQEILGSSS